jgi:hypothetical protein
VQRHFQNAFGNNLSAFFNAWIYGTGNPTYNVSWYNSGNKIVLKLQQTRSTGATAAYFPMPVVLTVSNASGSASKRLVIYDRGGSVAELNDGVLSPSFAGSSFSYVLPFTPASVSFDPNNETLATGTVAQTFSVFEEPLLLEGDPGDLLLRQQAKPAQAATASVWPNPANEQVRITRKATSPAQLQVVNAAGTIVLEQRVSGQNITINTRALPGGNYTLVIREQNKVSESLPFIVRH